MKHKMPDGRELMAAITDIEGFFREHSIVGRVIADMRPSELDYIIGNLCDMENIYETACSCGIETDGCICIIFDDGDSMEAEFSGSGPVLLGFNTADLPRYPEPNGDIYAVRTMFGGCIGRRIVSIELEVSGSMMFPCYRGMDMSEDDDGVYRIKFLLDDGTTLALQGWIDYFQIEHLDSNGELVYVPMKRLLDELDEQHLERYLRYEE